MKSPLLVLAVGYFIVTVVLSFQIRILKIQVRELSTVDAKMVDLIRELSTVDTKMIGLIEKIVTIIDCKKEGIRPDCDKILNQEVE